MLVKNIKKKTHIYNIMLKKFYVQENYFKEKLRIFTQVKENQRIILQNDNNLIIYDSDDEKDNCNNFLFILNFLVNIIKKENKIQTEQLKEHVENLFSEYFRFIDEVIEFLNKRQIFTDQYLILLSKIDENVNNIKKGLLLLICTHKNENLTLFYKSILFVLFDFSRLFEQIKKNINFKNTKLSDNYSEKKKHRKDNSF